MLPYQERLDGQGVSQLERISKARFDLVEQSYCLGRLAFNLELVATNKLDTAGTDGRHFFFNPAFVARQTARQLIALWAHEISHLTRGHIWRFEHEADHELANVAADFAINGDLVRMGFELPEGGLFDIRYDRMSAEEILATIRKADDKDKDDMKEASKKTGQFQKPDRSEDGEDTQDDDGQDPDDEQDEEDDDRSARNGQDEDEDENGQEGSDDDENDDSGNSDASDDDQDDDGQDSGDEDEDDQQDDDQDGQDDDGQDNGQEEKKGGLAAGKKSDDLETQWAMAARNIASHFAKTTGQELTEAQKHALGLDRFERVPDIPSEVREFLQASAAGRADAETWKRPNARFAPLGLYLPSPVGQAIPTLGIVIDTSASCVDFARPFLEMLTDVLQDVDYDRLVLMQADDKIVYTGEFENGEKPETREIDVYGRGWTSFIPALESMRDDYDATCVIYMTDMEGAFPRGFDTPVLWANVNPGVKTCPYGRMIMVDSLKTTGRR